MKPYLDVVRLVMTNGTWSDNRTGIPTLSYPGAAAFFNLDEGFPAVTTKKLAFKSVVGELCGFLRASRSAADFRALGCKVWDQNANETPEWLANAFREGEDDLGPVYGCQWRNWPAYKLLPVDKVAQIEAALKRGFRAVSTLTDEGQKKVLLYKAIDQLRDSLDTIIKNPSSRRILFHAWNPAVIDEVALPACHVLYQFHVNELHKTLALTMFIRSNDLGLGMPFNVAEGAALLHLVGRLTGLKPSRISYFVGDAHIYSNHMDMLNEQLTREPKPLPKLVISDRVPEFAKTGKYQPEWLELIEPSDFSLVGYEHHAPITAPMAV